MIKAVTSPEGCLELGLDDRNALRWAVVDVAGPLEEARRRLDLSPIAAVALGRVLAATALLLRFTATNIGRLVFEVLGDGPLGRITGEIDDQGTFRGQVANPQVSTPEGGDLSTGWAVGRGMLRVTRESPQGPYTSQVALTNGEIGTDLAHFLEQSEQIRSAAMVGVLPCPGGIAAAGGLLVEALPGTEDAVIRQLERNIARQPGVSALLAAGGVRALADGVLEGFPHRAEERYPLRYRCRCNADSLQRQLKTLEAAERDSLFDDDDSVRAECAFCGDIFTYSRQDLAPAN